MYIFQKGDITLSGEKEHLIEIAKGIYSDSYDSFMLCFAHTILSELDEEFKKETKDYEYGFKICQSETEERVTEFYIRLKSCNIKWHDNKRNFLVALDSINDVDTVMATMNITLFCYLVPM